MESLPLTFTMRRSLIFLNLLLLITVKESRQTSTSKYYLHITGLASVTFTAGTNATLQCNFSTDNSMELSLLSISWSKEGEEKWTFSLNSESDERRLEEISGGMADLPLVHIQQADGGIYVCTIKYRAMEKNVTTAVIVKDPSNVHSTPASPNGRVSSLHSTATAKHPTDSSLHPIPANQHHLDSSLHFNPATQHPPDSSLHPIPANQHPSDSSLHPIPANQHHLDSSLDLNPATQHPSDPSLQSTLASKATKVASPTFRPEDEFRTVKIGMVAAVLSSSCCLTFFIYCFFSV
ncbi:uncharacterized protein [Pyxicephalus adspersus]|uniref:uncharacterized protein n=1 Tax=Pyxicephalus adspersus TaxID=30357 RepID=UPI003B59E813